MTPRGAARRGFPAGGPAPESGLSRLEVALGHAFADRSLLARALTHRSFGPEHYERLEFLGDGLVNFLIAEALFAAHPQAPEGVLTRMRASLVREETLAGLARELPLAPLLRLGTNENQSGVWRRDTVLADVVEALLAAVYLDAGFMAVRDVVARLFAARLRTIPDVETLKDPKTRLQEYLQDLPRPLPEYRVLAEHGPPHKRTFDVACRLVDGTEETTASGPARKQAEQDAARRMLACLTGADAGTDASVVPGAPTARSAARFPAGAARPMKTP